LAYVLLSEVKTFVGSGNESLKESQHEM